MHHIVPHHLWDIDRSEFLVGALMSAWAPTHYCLTQKSQWVQGLFSRWLRCLFTLRGSGFLWCWPDAWAGCALGRGIFFIFHFASIGIVYSTLIGFTCALPFRFIGVFWTDTLVFDPLLNKSSQNLLCLWHLHLGPNSSLCSFLFDHEEICAVF